MRLKSLEIKGFKSFADKTVIHFDEGITGVIGPNGCGKSNIIDSIRWVIGEQKISALRSENQSALVFNGSKTRSASGLAEVSLTFENTRNLLPTEFSTVTVTRKFYKNGDSEYRLNDVQCRLKDIHNLFLDTGISTDSYAIIELGMVDDIIRDKENSRRRMLEQAAGITIYKTRKKEAKSKLDATEQDLARIEDLLFEINNQLKMLESQAKKAEKYYEIKKGMDIVIFVTGNIIDYAVDAALIVEKLSGIKVGIVSMPTVKPIDKKLIIKKSKDAKYIFSIEEHSVIGGLGAQIGSVISENNINVKFKIFGIEDKFIKSVGDRSFLCEEAGLSPKIISKKIINIIKQKSA